MTMEEQFQPSVKFRKINEAFCRIEADRSIIAEMSDKFQFFVPGYRFMPSFKHKMWDGKIRLINMLNQSTYAGLIPQMVDFCNDNSYKHEIVEYCFDRPYREEDENFLKSIRLTAAGKPILARDYQMEAVKEAIKTQRLLLLSPTSSGKSLIAYLMVRWWLENNDPKHKLLIVVPTTGLVVQMFEDFKDYSRENGWPAADSIHKIYDGAPKVSNKRITIATWQSIYRQKREFFDDYHAVIADECHQYKADAIKGIMEKCHNADFRIGMTGTLDGMQCSEMVITGLFGPVKRVITTKELMDRKEISGLKIVVLRLIYSDEEKSICKKFSYQEEIDWIVTHKKRNDFLKQMALSLKGNTLILFQFVEKHGIPLYEATKAAAATGRKVIMIYGGTEADERERLKQIIEKEDNAIIFGSVGCMSTGVSIRRLHNIIFSSPTKSLIRVLQSIGRGLRQGDGKTHCKLIDISDDLRHKKHLNYAYEHMMERCNIYDSEQFSYSYRDFRI